MRHSCPSSLYPSERSPIFTIHGENEVTYGTLGGKRVYYFGSRGNRRLVLIIFAALIDRTPIVVTVVVVGPCVLLQVFGNTVQLHLPIFVAFVNSPQFTLDAQISIPMPILQCRLSSE